MIHPESEPLYAHKLADTAAGCAAAFAGGITLAANRALLSANAVTTVFMPVIFSAPENVSG